MKIDIQFINFDSDSELFVFINKKLEKLKLINDSLIIASVYLKNDSKESPQNKISEIKIHSSKGEYFAKKKCGTFEESIDHCIQALRKQLLKVKGK